MGHFHYGATWVYMGFYHFHDVPFQIFIKKSPALAEILDASPETWCDFRFPVLVQQGKAQAFLVSN
jgi:hypothetical protein